MKRFLALTTGAMAIMLMAAQEFPAVYADEAFSRLSPSGKWAVSSAGVDYPTTIYDFEGEKSYVYSDYTGGSGNYISDTGIVVGCKVEADVAAYWQNGQWKLLPTSQGAMMSFANGITPDGSRIVGDLSPSGYSGDYEGTMVVPCYWDLQPDGTYAGPFMLPYPSKDFTNRRPQYVTCVQVSADGKIIAGQIRDFLGMVSQPVIYTQDESGEWKWTKLLNDLFYPEGYELPEEPEEAPTQYDFMTPDEIKDYEAALQEWSINSPEDYDLYPDIIDFMTEEEQEAFEEAALDWNERYENYDSALWKLVGAVPNFEYNNIYMTSDGKTIATTDAKYYMDEAHDISFKIFKPYIIDIANNYYKAFEPVDDINIMVTGIADDGTVTGQWNDSDYGVFNGYILPVGASEFIPIYDYVKGVDSSTAKWMEENMTHTYDVYDYENDIFTPSTLVATGIPTINSDMSVIGFAQYNFWDYDDIIRFYGYLISLPPFSGVEEISDTDLKGDNVLRVFNLQGLKVMETKNRSEILSLKSGIYIINGSKYRIK